MRASAWFGFLGLLLTLLTAGPRPARAQTWQRDPVLSQLLIRQLAQGPTGLLWVAADEGVFRYDGYELVPLSALCATPSPEPNLTHAEALAFDRRGQLWIGCAQGLFRLRGRRLEQVPLPGVGQRAAGVSTLALHPVSGALWVGYGSHGLAVLPGAAAPAQAVALPFESPVSCLLPAADSGVWAVSALHRVAYCSRQQSQLRPYRPTGELLPVPDTDPQQLVGTYALYEAQPDGSLRECLRWLPGRNEPNFIPGRQPRTWQWVAAGQLVQLTWAPGRRYPQVQLRPAGYERAGQLLRQYTVFTDASGLRWSTSSAQRGTYKQRVGTESLQVLPSRPLARYSTRALARLPDGRLLVGAYGATLVQPADSPRAPLRPLQTLEDGRPALVIMLDMLTTRQGQVLFAEENHPFAVLDPRTRQLQRLAWPRQAFTSSSCVLQDGRGTLWGGSSRGLFRLDVARRQAIRYQRPDGQPVPFAEQTIMEMSADAAGGLWLATNAGLYRLQPETGAVEHFGATQNGRYHLPTNDLLCTRVDSAGRVWVGTRDQGLLLVLPGRGLMRHISTAQGLPSNTVATIEPDEQGQVWCGTYAGLVRYDPRTGRVAVFNENDGLADAELNRQSSWRDADGTLYFGGVGGIHKVWPGRIADGHDPAPHLLLTGYTQHHSQQDTTRTYYLPGTEFPQPTLAPYDAFVELQLALTDYLAPDQARFQYRLVGAANEQWRSLGSTRTLTLQGLPAGKYAVEVRGISGRGVPARAEIRLPLQVEAVWWRQPWAWLLAAAAVAAMLYGLHRRRLARVRREERLRNRIAADLHDEVGTLLTRVNLQAELLRQTSAPGSPALDRLLTNSRAAASTMRDIVWSIDAQADTVGALLDRMRDHLDQTAAPAGLNTHLTTHGLPDHEPLTPELRQHFYLVFKEAVTNAVRHARHATALHVALVRQNGQLILTVDDDGQPAVSTTRSGMGLRNMQQRAAALRGEVVAAPAAQGGFQVRLAVPW